MVPVWYCWLPKFATMNAASLRNMAMEVFDQAVAILPVRIGQDVAPHRSDPVPFKTKGSEFMKLRILPRTKAPVRFWSSSWCFYEVGIGHYARRDGEGLNVGGIQFLQFSNNAQCGAGAYAKQVEAILTQLHGLRPEFRLDRPGSGDQDHCSLERRYFVKQFAAFPVQVAAADLAWLIKESLSRFQACIPGGTPKGN